MKGQHIFDPLRKKESSWQWNNVFVLAYSLRHLMIVNGLQSRRWWVCDFAEVVGQFEITKKDERHWRLNILMQSEHIWLYTKQVCSTGPDICMYLRTPFSCVRHVPLCSLFPIIHWIYVTPRIWHVFLHIIEKASSSP